jgi:hypothetical protein
MGIYKESYLMLSQKQLNDVCLQDQGRLQCRYLGKIKIDGIHSGKSCCLKLSKRTKEHCNASVEFLNKNNLPCSEGDNCEGYLIMKYLEQGYDKK